jgi:hypothetical protein
MDLTDGEKNKLSDEGDLMVVALNCPSEKFPSGKVLFGVEKLDNELSTYI